MIYGFTNIAHWHRAIINIMASLLATETTVSLFFLATVAPSSTITFPPCVLPGCIVERITVLVSDCVAVGGIGIGAFPSMVVLPPGWLTDFEAAVTAVTTAYTIC
jgi:hypothetical protein